ncbi:PHB depolymerase family esterase [Mycolicibacterium sp.]|uniref:extracellular catalytic domain type 1 short-chain-length polyhydroxyalkanoate depolymerase n=1 Tax=Mycolicibacterium sp. TaxID=2320850 RepID=UPI001A2B1166|nr:PHB depolymerase family esterase [Mycolicibacterium sp.]MBJ7336836.1 prolyl oligopeptidase family serine peptidase [Mycolicibacterium sp.]
MVPRLAAVIVAVLALAGCVAPGSAEPVGFTPGSTAHAMTFGGLDRGYRLYIPDGVSSPAPLVVMLHGGFGSAAQAERAYGWDELAKNAKFVVAYPDGVGRAWNVGGCCGRPGRDHVDDVGFVSEVVADVSAHVGIDPARIYATGISNGGMMTYALACNSDRFAAIGPVAATQLDACPAPRPTSVLHIHGTADRMIRYDGGPGDGVARIDGPPVLDVNAFWRNVDQCSMPAVTTGGPVSTSTAACPDGRSVALITIDGAGHQWPGSQLVREGADPPTQTLNATSTLWSFFAAHSR